MILFAANLVLAVAWSALFSGGGLLNLLFGFVVGYAVLWLVRPLFGDKARYFRKLIDLVRLAGFFAYELVISSLAVVWDVVTPAQRSNPGIIAVPLETCSPAELTTLANLVSLTPGTLSLDISDDRRTLYVHAMFADDAEAVRRSIKHGMEQRVLAALR